MATLNRNSPPLPSRFDLQNGDNTGSNLIDEINIDYCPRTWYHFLHHILTAKQCESSQHGQARLPLYRFKDFDDFFDIFSRYLAKQDSYHQDAYFVKIYCLHAQSHLSRLQHSDPSQTIHRQRRREILGTVSSIYQQLQKFKIGVQCADFYVEWAHFYILRRRHRKALCALRLGMKHKAMPSDKLKTFYDQIRRLDVDKKHNKMNGVHSQHQIEGLAVKLHSLCPPDFEFSSSSVTDFDGCLSESDSDSENGVDRHLPTANMDVDDSNASNQDDSERENTRSLLAALPRRVVSEPLDSEPSDNFEEDESDHDANHAINHGANHGVNGNKPPCTPARAPSPNPMPLRSVNMNHIVNEEKDEENDDEFLNTLRAPKGTLPGHLTNGLSGGLQGGLPQIAEHRAISPSAPTLQSVRTPFANDKRIPGVGSKLTKKGGKLSKRKSSGRYKPWTPNTLNRGLSKREDLPKQFQFASKARDQKNGSNHNKENMKHSNQSNVSNKAKVSTMNMTSPLPMSSSKGTQRASMTKQTRSTTQNLQSNGSKTPFYRQHQHQHQHQHQAQEHQDRVHETQQNHHSNACNDDQHHMSLPREQRRRLSAPPTPNSWINKIKPGPTPSVSNVTSNGNSKSNSNGNSKSNSLSVSPPRIAAHSQSESPPKRAYHSQSEARSKRQVHSQQNIPNMISRPYANDKRAHYDRHHDRHQDRSRHQAHHQQPAHQQRQRQHQHQHQQQQQQQQQHRQRQHRSRSKGWKPKTLSIKGRSLLQLKKIGRGGSCEVFQVITQDTLEILALKKITAKPLEMENFRNEIDLLLKLKGNPHCIQMVEHEIIENLDDNRYHIRILFEFGEIDLNHILKQRGGFLKDMVHLKHIWRQIIIAVDTVHQFRIVHGDLKPANFLMVKGQLKLIDFGIAKQICSNETIHIARDSMVGTLNYISPEAISAPTVGGNCFKLGKAADVWSMGCILHQMCFGFTPFTHINPQRNKMLAILGESYKPLIRKHANPFVNDITGRCVRRDPASRITVEQLLEHPFLREYHVILQRHSGRAVVGGRAAAGEKAVNRSI